MLEIGKEEKKKTKMGTVSSGQSVGKNMADVQLSHSH